VKTYILDTNALISFLTDRNLDQQVKIAKIFNDAADLKVKILCPQNVLTEFVYVMQTVYQVNSSEIKTMINDFIGLPGTQIFHDINMKLLLNYWPDHFPDFGDAIVAAVCKVKKGSFVFSFDRKFNAKLKKLGLSVVTF
jgi:predicted nucleic-acid-binding protein